METRSAIASSGSKLGSTPPNSANAPVPPLAAAALEPPPPPLPSSPVTIGEVIKTSDGRTPCGIVTRWLLLFLFTASINACNFGAFSSDSPILTISTATFPFFSCFAILTNFFSSASIGLPIKTTTRCPPFLFFRCLSASCAICSPPGKFVFPPTLTLAEAVRIFPISSVGEHSTCTPDPAIVSIPTVLSGFCWVLLPQTRFAASC
mmetsp:Transcript_9655/g.15845  ORF Transcript_9655/g.15845 Transcript_9655/m.15845 type:complete len:206 (-) Transcript_9655:218-835(-)